jgi:hypothetical protein
VPAVSQQPAVQLDAHEPPELDVLDVLDVLDASSPPLLLVLLVEVPPPSSPPPEALVMYVPLDPFDPDDPLDPLFEPPKLLLIGPASGLNLPLGTGSPAAHAPTTPLVMTATRQAPTLSQAVCIDSLVYAQPRLKQRGSTSED